MAIFILSRLEENMKVLNNYIVQGITGIKQALCRPTQKLAVLQNSGEISYEKILDVLRKSENFIEPVKKDFDSTKSMFEYAKARCVSTLREKDAEHAVAMHTKTNKVLGEFIGDSTCVPMRTFFDLNIDMSDVVVMHGHPRSFPISLADVQFLRDTGIKSIIAVDINGEFSFVGRKYGIEKPKSKIGLVNWYNKKSAINQERQAFTNYSASSSDDREFYKNAVAEDGWKSAIDYTLSTYIPPMNLRYITNYGYLKKTK